MAENKSIINLLNECDQPELTASLIKKLEDPSIQLSLKNNVNAAKIPLVVAMLANIDAFSSPHVKRCIEAWFKKFVKKIPLEEREKFFYTMWKNDPDVVTNDVMKKIINDNLTQPKPTNTLPMQKKK